MNTYTITVNDDERSILMFALGCAYKSDATLSLARRLASAPAVDATPAPSKTGGGTEAARAVLAPPAPSVPVSPSSSILWSDDPRAPKVDKCERMEVTPVKVEMSGDRLKVSWQGRGRGYVYASVWLWASNIFDAVKSRVRKPSVLYVSRSKDGKFLHIVGLEV